MSKAAESPNTTDRVEIPAEAREKILGLYAELNQGNSALMQSAEYKALQDARFKFVEFLMATKTSLGLPANEFWDLEEDVSAFVKLGMIAPPLPIDAQTGEAVAPSPSSEPVPVIDAEVIDSREDCVDPGDVSGA